METAFAGLNRQYRYQGIV